MTLLYIMGVLGLPMILVGIIITSIRKNGGMFAGGIFINICDLLGYILMAVGISAIIINIIGVCQ